jgi:hypothetical protein
MGLTEYDIKNKDAMDAVCNDIEHSASIYDFHHDDINMSALDDIYYRHIDAAITIN